MSGEEKGKASTMTIAQMIADADVEIAMRAVANMPLAVSYKVPCPCGSPECDRSFVVTVHELQAELYCPDALRSIH